MANFRRAASIGLAAATLAAALAYVLGAEALLQTPYAEPAHGVFMSLIEGGGHESMARLHGGGESGGSIEQEMSASEMRNMNQSITANNILGSPKSMAAGGLAAVTVMGVVPLAAAAFVISRKQRSLVVAGLLAASGVALMILPLANMNFMIPGPIIGAAVGLGILGLGIAKGIVTARAVKVAPA